LKQVEEQQRIASSFYKGPDRYVVITPQDIMKYCQTSGTFSEEIIDERVMDREPLIVMEESQAGRQLEQLIEQKKVVALARVGGIVGLIVPGDASVYFMPIEPGLPGTPIFNFIEVYCPKCGCTMYVQIYDEDNPPKCDHGCPLVPK